ncbi:TPA: hypothetical protein HA239_00270 [Candidatus Woesearchaeota archaeon]|nr:hypothetical protein [Candidatus Woesearchaeota archaeon]HIH40833.1 hypothetical protein [Candidatus Woesearchaeota archaeon]
MAKDKEDSDMAIDFSSLKKIFSGSSAKKYGVYALLLLIMLFSAYIRMMPYHLPMAEDQARQSIYNNIARNIQAQVDTQYPNLPQQSKEAMINEQLQTVVSQQQSQIEALIAGHAEQIRALYRDDSGTTYLGDIDSYFWLRYARNIVDTGQLADEYRDGVAYDNHMNAPNGLPATQNLYPYLEAFIYKFMRIFDPGMNLLKAGFYTPIFLSFIAIIAAFLVGKKLSGDIAGLIAALLIAVNPTVLSRSLGSDNDMVNAVFPLLVMLFAVYAFDSKDQKKTMIFSAVAGLLLGAYSFAWSGWWFMFLFIILALGIYIGYIAVYEFIDKKRDIKEIASNKNIRRMLMLLGVYIVVTFISLAVFGNAGEFIQSFTNPLRIVNLKDAAKGGSLWPNVYTTVAELNSADVGQAIVSLGGALFFILALMGATLSFVNLKNKNHSMLTAAYLAGAALYFMIIVGSASSGGISTIMFAALLVVPMLAGFILSWYYKYELEPAHSILTIIWLMATLYAITKGVRFIVLIAPVFAVSFGVFFGTAAEKMSSMLGKSLDMSETIPKAVFILLIALVLIQPVKNGIAVSYSYAPGVNDAWVESLEKIKAESQPDAIINSWWDFGHWFKYFADRRVTSDGASQNEQQAHWVGNALLTDDEQLSVGILRMLDCGGAKAEQEITKLTGDTYDSVNLIYRYLKMDSAAVKADLMKTASEEKADEILSYMFCQPPEDYFITSEDMVGKAPVWAHFGSWNFERAKIYSYFQTEKLPNFTAALVQEFGYTEQEAQSIYYEISSLSTDSQINSWIAPWPSYGGQIGCAKQDESTLRCNLQTTDGGVLPLTVNLASKDASIVTSTQTIHPKRFGYVENGQFRIKEYSGETMAYSIVLVGESSLLVMEDELVGSMFTRMFYLDGQGLTHFRKFHDVTDISGQRIITWKISW